ncbi:hypothetical protein DFH08DRAFT_934296 [Mycena albidolilacea]|uniref:Uncharacterized protein n=1 Tax=Mycena albidolilacea TaxID=1033008 RepID=A0AAD7AA85_9AGAR|nr:hypothetical protein DFH08DRAFT_934296 [Mycena albidolilacea]
MAPRSLSHIVLGIRVGSSRRLDRLVEWPEQPNHPEDGHTVFDGEIKSQRRLYDIRSRILRVAVVGGVWSRLYNPIMIVTIVNTAYIKYMTEVRSWALATVEVGLGPDWVAAGQCAGFLAWKSPAAPGLPGEEDLVVSVDGKGKDVVVVESVAVALVFKPREDGVLRRSTPPSRTTCGPERLEKRLELGSTRVELARVCEASTWAVRGSVDEDGEGEEKKGIKMRFLSMIRLGEHLGRGESCGGLDDSQEAKKELDNKYSVRVSGCDHPWNAASAVASSAPGPRDDEPPQDAAAASTDRRGNPLRCGVAVSDTFLWPYLVVLLATTIVKRMKQLIPLDRYEGARHGKMNPDGPDATGHVLRYSAAMQERSGMERARV